MVENHGNASSLRHLRARRHSGERVVRRAVPRPGRASCSPGTASRSSSGAASPCCTPVAARRAWLRPGGGRGGRGGCPARGACAVNVLYAARRRAVSRRAAPSCCGARRGRCCWPAAPRPDRAGAGAAAVAGPDRRAGRAWRSTRAVRGRAGRGRRRRARYLGAWIKPDALTQPGRVEAVGALEQDAGPAAGHRATRTAASTQMFGTESRPGVPGAGRDADDQLGRPATTGRSLPGEHDELIREQARRGPRAAASRCCCGMRWEMDRPNLRADDVVGRRTTSRPGSTCGRSSAEERADNVSWVWCPTAEGFIRGDAPAFYPGDDQVDWTCVDVYAGNVVPADRRADGPVPAVGRAAPASRS